MRTYAFSSRAGELRILLGQRQCDKKKLPATLPATLRRHCGDIAATVMLPPMSPATSPAILPAILPVSGDLAVFPAMLPAMVRVSGDVAGNRNLFARSPPHSRGRVVGENLYGGTQSLHRQFEQDVIRLSCHLACSITRKKNEKV